MNEIWKDIEGYEGYYQISNLGNVKSLDRAVNNNGGIRNIKGQPIRNFTNGSGYTQCKLRKEGVLRQPYIHKLVASHFIDNPLSLSEVNHKDHDKSNNTVTNLEWITRSENMVKYHEFIGTYSK